MSSAHILPSPIVLPTPQLPQPVVNQGAQNLFSSITKACSEAFPALTSAFHRLGWRSNFSPFTAVCVGIAGLVVGYALSHVVKSFFKSKIEPEVKPAPK